MTWGIFQDHNSVTKSGSSEREYSAEAIFLQILVVGRVSPHLMIWAGLTGVNL